ncbi:MAG: ATP-dependent Clp protease ATP-binding subunit [Clostridiales bacterium]|nr:ATP-dependent Clp protease ATP-binding subunit [Clostridiales bacterium]
MQLHQYTKQAQQVLRMARALAKSRDTYLPGTEHILVGMMREKSGVAGLILRSLPVNEDMVLHVLDDLTLPTFPEISAEQSEFTQEADRVLLRAEELASRFEDELTGTEHLLLSMLELRDCTASQILLLLDVNLNQLYAEVMRTVGKTPEPVVARKRHTGRGADPEGSLLEKFASDLTARAKRDELDPLIGREEELGRVVQILSRRGKNNPCLIGEPGVGKTAIVEGLAARIALGNVPEHLSDKRVLVLDVAGMVAGTKYRGEFEERMKTILRETEAAGDILLFIDELHTIIGAGGAEGSLDAANIMKPSLSRGRIQVIGATTVREYRKHIEKDAALARRFQSVLVEEPDIRQTIEILEGLRPRYEEHHQVVISDEGLRAAAEFSARYVSDRFLPDKAIDLMDEAAARLRLGSNYGPDALQSCKNKISEKKTELEDALTNGDIGASSRLLKEQRQLQEEYEKLKKKQQSSRRGKKQVGEDEVADVVAEWTHIPVKRLTESEFSRLRHMESSLHKRVIAQDDAVQAVSRAVRRGRVGLKSPARPIGSFLFLGPTGVGKTEVSRALAEEMFGTEDAMIRVDMSEYMEKHSVSKMIGSPPGYVGYDEGGQLSEQVRRHPYAVVLFDEIEKAHPDVFNILLQVLDEGHITDSQGRKVDFKNTIIIMTSNAGAQSIIEPKKLGFAAAEDENQDYERMKSNVMEEVRRIFRPEFLNRIDEIVVFHALSREHMKAIVSLMTDELKERCQKQMGIRLTVRDSVKKHVVEEAYDPKYGARPLRRAIQTMLEDALADEILSGRVKEGDAVTVSMKKGEVCFQV